MPLPTPNSNESKDAFIGRCMTNDSTNNEFPDTAQRLAVCGSLWAEHNRQRFESYSDYGQEIRSNAKRGIELNERDRVQWMKDFEAINPSGIRFITIDENFPSLSMLL